MALVLSIKKDGVFYVGDVPVKVDEIDDALRFKVRVMKSGIDNLYTVTDKKASEILPGVKVSAGKNGSAHAVKVVIQADPNIKILRERLYNEGNGE